MDTEGRICESTEFASDFAASEFLQLNQELSQVKIYPSPVQALVLQAQTSAANSLWKLFPHAIGKPVFETLSVSFPCRKVKVAPCRNK